MNQITESILARRSVRTYDGVPLDQAMVQKIRDYIARLQAPFGAACRIEIVRTAGEQIKLGTYGAIRGASDYLALVVHGDAPLAQEGAAYIFEQTVLYCTSLGLGTCWLAGFFDRGGFKKHLALRPGERLRAVSPIGRAADKPHRSLSTLMSGCKPTPRKPFGETFFDSEFAVPLTEQRAGQWAHPLEMVRRGPSANNKQPWRVVMEGDMLHFYETPSMGYQRLDGGIALCHFAETCVENGIAGHFENAPHPAHNKAEYVISWVGE